MKINFKGAIFDADGTLLDSMSIWPSLGEKFLRKINVEPEKNLSEILAPMSLKESTYYLRNKYSLDMRPPEIFDEIMSLIKDFYEDEVGLKKGVKKYLEFLSQKNIPMVIASSGDFELLNRALFRNDIGKYFKKIFTCVELGMTKRSSEIFTLCSDFLKLEPKETAVFEDSLFALKAAKEADFITFGVEDDSNINEREEIIKISDFYIKNFEEGEIYI